MTLTIGGNDVEFVQIAMHCLANFDCNQRSGFGSDGFTKLNSGKTLTLPEYVDLRLAILASQLSPTYTRIKEATSYRATVAVAGYPELFQPKPSVLCGSRATITRGEREFLSDAAHRFDRLLAAASARTGVFYAPVIDQFSPHLPCGNGEVWLGGVLTGGTDTGQKLHPTEAGYRAYASIINANLAGWTSSPPRGVKPNGLPYNPAPRAAPAPVALRAFAQAVTATDTGWLDESLDEAPPYDDTVLESVATDGMAVSADGTIIFDEWLTAELPNLPAVTVDELRAVAASTTPTVAIENVDAPECIESASAGQAVTLTAAGFAPGATVSLASGPADTPLTVLMSGTADANGIATFSDTATASGTVPVSYEATGATAGAKLARGTTVLNAPTAEACNSVVTPAPNTTTTTTPTPTTTTVVSGGGGAPDTSVQNASVQGASVTAAPAATTGGSNLALTGTQALLVVLFALAALMAGIVALIGSRRLRRNR